MYKLNVCKAMVLTIAFLLLLAGPSMAAFEWGLEQSIPLAADARDFAESPDGKRLFVLTGEGTILVLDQNGQTESTIPGPFTADRLYVSRDGSKLLLGGEGEKRLQVISLADRFDIDIAGSPFKGDAAAAVAVVVFSDFQWPYCARVNPFLDQLVEKYPDQVKVVFKNFPLRSHQMARPAAQAALAAHAQGKFWPYHDKLFASFKTLNEASLQKFAAEVGLDIEQFNRDRASQGINQQIIQDMKVGQAAGVRGTPTIFVNGLLLKERSLAEVSRLIDNELKRLKEK